MQEFRNLPVLSDTEKAGKAMVLHCLAFSGSSRGVQHIFNENAIAGGGVVYQNVGHSPNEPSVLNNGTARHADVK